MQNEKDKLAREVVDHMMKEDLFSQWLGVEVLEVKEGYSRISRSNNYFNMVVFHLYIPHNTEVNNR